jgi:hypothetical protein
VDFLSEGASVVPYTNDVQANAPLQIAADALIPGASVSTVVRSLNAVPLVVERTQSWDARGYGGHGGTAVTPSTRWLFAEGAQGYFDTFVLLTNDNDGPVDVTVRFLLEDATVVTEVVTVPGHARSTIHTDTSPSLRDRRGAGDVLARHLPRMAGGSQQVIANRSVLGGSALEDAVARLRECPGAATARLLLLSRRGCERATRRCWG